jgi:hypothetical protein
MLGATLLLGAPKHRALLYGAVIGMRIGLALGAHAVGLGWIMLAVDAVELGHAAYKLKASSRSEPASMVEVGVSGSLCLLGLILMII